MKVFIQARMSSSRLPGKVLTNISNDENTLDLIIGKLKKIFSIKNIVILTSKQRRDDKIAEYCKKKNINIFRGPLNNVGLRYFLALKNCSVKYFMRLSADSPLIDKKIILKLKNFKNLKKYDIITNVCPRSFPKGQSVEIVSTKIYEENFKFFEKNDLEHVTSFFYKNKEKFRIKNFKNEINFSSHSVALDTKKDLLKIKKLFLDFKDCHEYSFKKILNCMKKLKYEKN
jgi:spore coat polysaccharide biosynthesis protein SpsF